MIPKALLPTLAAVTATGIFCACTHTPPGTSVEVALARKPEVVRLPAPPEPPKPAATASNNGGGGGGATTRADYNPDKAELVADAYSRGEFCMKAGADQEAITAFREVVKLDPSFTDAWNNLAALYEKAGQEKLAMDAFKKSKIARQ